MITVGMLFLIASGCSLPLLYLVQHETHDGIESRYTLDKACFYQDNMYRISLCKMEENVGKYFCIEIAYAGYNWLNMDGNVTLQVDSAIMKLKDEHPKRSASSYRVVCETLLLKLQDAQLHSIVNAQYMRIQFFGDPITMDPKKLEFIRRFYNEYK
jgi:hypothetical protein